MSIPLFPRKGNLPIPAIICIPAFVFLISLSQAAHASDRLLDIVADELRREMAILQKQEIPPYFMGITVSDVYNVSVSASFGSLTASNESAYRVMTVDVRVGDHSLDNTHEIRGGYGSSSGGYVYVARDDDEDALRSAIWQETNRKYREALERYAKVKTNVALKVAAEDTSADFSREPELADFYEPPVDAASLVGNRGTWEEKVKKYSSLFLGNENIYGGNASFSFTCERKNLVTSEGARLSQNAMYARISVSGFIKSDDGMELPLYKTYFAYRPGDLPGDDEITADVETIVHKLERLRDAPLIEPYTGPAILSGRAAAVFFHEILGHRVEGHRQKSEHEGQTFKKHVGEKILPEHLNIVFDPTMKRFGGQNLMGYYKYDDEGIRARPVTIVESGILKGFLMSRSPIENFPRSNGHGRAQAGRNPVARQSNMLVSTTRPVPYAKLREKLIELCRKQDKPYGLLIQDIQGGFTFTGRTMPNVFNLMPTEVYRVYTDGRPDELVRGVDLVGTPLVMFSMITDAGEKPEVFNGLCGAESGSVPVSAVSPPLLVSQVEVQKKAKSQERPPILPRPDLEREIRGADRTPGEKRRPDTAGHVSGRPGTEHVRPLPPEPAPGTPGTPAAAARKTIPAR